MASGTMNFEIYVGQQVYVLLHHTHLYILASIYVIIGLKFNCNIWKKVKFEKLLFFLIHDHLCELKLFIVNGLKTKLRATGVCSREQLGISD